MISRQEEQALRLALERMAASSIKPQGSRFKIQKALDSGLGPGMTEDGPRGGRRGKTKENVLAFFAFLREAEGNPQEVGLPPRP
jgi:hypothetical protein